MGVGARGGGGGSRSSRERRIPYGVMLLLAFAAAVLGFMLLHKLRERRVVTMLIRDKDRDLMTLHLLLQKERESSKELKRKIEELKAKTSSLRAQKMDLRNKFEEIQSMVSSLKDEHRVLESKIEEKQNEITLLQQREIDSSDNEKSQTTALTQILKHKEAEIEELKRLVENPTKIWSVSSDDPTKSSTVPLVHEDDKDETGDANPKEEQSENFAKQDDGEAIVEGEDANASEGIETKLEKQHDGQGLGDGMSNAGEQKTEERPSAEILVDENSGATEKNNTDDTTIVIAGELNDNIGDTEGARRRNSTSEDGKEHGIELESPQGGQGPQPFGKISKHVSKLKKLDRLRKRRRGGRTYHNNVSGRRNAFPANKQSKVSGVSNPDGEDGEMELNDGMLHNAVDGKQTEEGEVMQQRGKDGIVLFTERQSEKQHSSETGEDSTATKVNDTISKPATDALEEKLDDENTGGSNVITSWTGKVDKMIRRREQHRDEEENSTENSQAWDKTKADGTGGQEANSILRNGE